MLTESQIQKNWDELLGVITSYSDGENRWSKLLDFYNKNENRLGLAPASGKEMYHSCFVGGYVAHVLNVYNSAFKLKELWADMGATIDFTDEELAFVSINHDLGKMGDFEHDNFIPQQDAWRKKTLGELYVKNPEIEFMKDFDRSLYLLQAINVPVNSKEYLAIKLHGGLYEKGNESYLINFSEDYKLHSNLPYILHAADAMSTRIESQNGVAKKPTAKKALKEVFKDTDPVAAAVATPKPVKKTSPLGKFL